MVAAVDMICLSVYVAEFCFWAVVGEDVLLIQGKPAMKQKRRRIICTNECN